jgi:ribosomal protein S18 acetylase RimI-like enzyme
MPTGADIVDAFVPHMLRRCARCRGKVLVAELDGEVAGFASILARVKSDEIEDGDVEYGLISDLIVAREFRKRGIGRTLLEAAESFAKSNGVKWLRVGVLAKNYAAERLYDSSGFEKLYIEREKEL